MEEPTTQPQQLDHQVSSSGAGGATPGEDTTTGLEATLSPVAVPAAEEEQQQQQQEEVPTPEPVDESSIEQAEQQEQPSELLQREPVALQEETEEVQQQQEGGDAEEEAAAEEEAEEETQGEHSLEPVNPATLSPAPTPTSSAPTPPPPPPPPPSKDPAANPVLLIVTVDIGAGQSDVIELRKGGDPGAAARSFCEKHGLPPHIVTPLTQHILDNLSKAKQQESLRQSGEELPQTESPPLEEEVPQQQVQQQPQGATEAERNINQKLSFANGMNDKLYEQLSNKLMPVSDSERMLTVNSVNRHPTTGNRSARSRPGSVSEVGIPSYLRGSAGYNPRDSVHLRLYAGASDMRAKQEAKRKAQQVEAERNINQSRSSMSWISQEMMRSRSHGPFENYGEMLYAEGLEAAAVKHSKAIAERAERESKEIEGATFRPEVSKLAKALWAGGDLSNQACWQRLSQDKRSKTLEAVEELKRNRETQELNECTFKPKVNPTSAALMADRSETLQMLRMSAHEQLFQDALRRQQKREELASWLPEEVTFKPKVNVSPQSADYLRHSYEHMGYSPPGSPTKDAGSDPGGVRASTVVDRLYMAQQRKNQKIEELRQRVHGEVDPETGKPLFRPEVGRPPRNCERNPTGAPIGEFLYINGLEEKRRKEAMIEAEKEEARRAAEAHHSTPTSSKLFARLKAKRFSQIFDYLDEAASGLLDIVGLVRNSTEHMDNLDIEVREDVELAAEAHAHGCKVPLLPSEAVLATATPEEQQQAVAALPPAPPVDLQTFSALMEGALLRKRKPRAYLVPSPTNKSVPSHPFKPAINPRSKKMAARLRPAELSPHDILHYNAEAVRTKHEALRRAMKDEALKGCTFQPRLNTNLINGKPVEGKALRSSGFGLGASMDTTPKRKVPPLPEGAMLLDEKTQQLAAMREVGPATGDELSHYMQLEAEVEDALAGVSGAHKRLSELDEGAPTPQGHEQPQPPFQEEQQQQQQQQQPQQQQPPPQQQQQHAERAPDLSQVIKSRTGEEPDERELAETEKMLNQMLGLAGGEEGAASGDQGGYNENDAINAEMMAALQPGSGKTDAEVLEILQRHMTATSQSPAQQQQQQQHPPPKVSRMSISSLSNSGGIGSQGRRSGIPSATNSMRVRETEGTSVGSPRQQDMGEYAADFAALESSMEGPARAAASSTSQVSKSQPSATSTTSQGQRAGPPKSASSNIKVDTLEELAASLSQWDHVLEPSRR